MRPEPSAPSLRTGDILELTVEKAVYQGLGLARHQGEIVFVHRGIPGERVRARVELARRGYARASIEAVLAPSGIRRTSPCPYFSSCGGCAHQDVSYAAQLEMKEAILRESLGRAGVPWDGAIPVRRSPEEGWRLRATLHVATGGGGLRLGLHEEGTHRVVDVERCLQLSASMTAAVNALRTALAGRPRAAEGIRHVELAESLDGGQLAVCLETDRASREAPGLATLLDGAPGVTGLAALARDGRRKVFVSLRGKPSVEATVLDLRFRIHVRSFFQANRFLVEQLARDVTEAVPEGGTVLDLYAGVGLFALPLGRRAERVRGAELNPHAADDGAVNARRAGLLNVRIERADVEEALAAWRVEPDERVVLDPPRTGAGPDVVRSVAARRPTVIVYVSCDPPTLGRDLHQLAALGYAPVTLSAYDMFPDTYHLETLAVLRPTTTTTTTTT